MKLGSRRKFLPFFWQFQKTHFLSKGSASFTMYPVFSTTETFVCIFSYIFFAFMKFWTNFFNFRTHVSCPSIGSVEFLDSKFVFVDGAGKEQAQYKTIKEA